MVINSKNETWIVKTHRMWSIVGYRARSYTSAKTLLTEALAFIIDWRSVRVDFFRFCKLCDFFAFCKSCRKELFLSCNSRTLIVILFRKLVADTLADSPGVLVNAAYPGICKTDIKRHMGVDKSITGNVISKPILSPLTSSAESGAKIPMVLATDPDLKGMWDYFFSQTLIQLKYCTVHCNLSLVPNFGMEHST